MFRKEKEKPSLKKVLLTDLLKPSIVNNELDCIRVNDEFNRIIAAVGYPREIQEGWLNRIVSAEGNFDVSMFIEPSSIEIIMNQLNQELIKQKADIMAAELHGVVNPSLQVQYEDTYNTLKKLQTGEEKLFDFSLYINAKAFNKDKLKLLSKKIESELNSILIVPKIPAMKMLQAFQSIMPIASNKLRIQRNIPSNALSACFPFTTSFLNLDKNGIMFGVNETNNIPIILDQYRFTNYNGLILGSSGSGKSFFVKLYIIRNLLNDLQTFIIDPQGEYSELAEKYAGEVIELSRKSDSMINALDLMGKDFGDKMFSLMDLFKIICGELTEVQKSVLDKALIETYKQKGILANSPETWKKRPPTLKDLHEVLEKQKHSAGRTETVTYEALLNRLRIYANGSFSFLSKQTSIDFDKKLISFNIKEMPNEVKPILMFLVLDFVFEKTQKDRERKLIVVDEAWSLLRYAEHAEYLFKICKTARKFGTGLVIITQEANDLLNSQVGNTVLANTAWKILLRQENAVIQELIEKFGLNKEETNYLLTAQAGQGLLFAMNDRIPLKVVFSEKEYDIITTNPDDLRKREILRKEVTEKSELNEDVYRLGRAYYKSSELSSEHKKFLKKAEYIETRQAGLTNAGACNYFIQQKNENESIEHQFLVQLIYEELQKYTEAVQRYAVQKPDLVFVANGKKIAFEIETGKVIQNVNEFEEKIKTLNKEYNDWYFILTNKRLRRAYKKHGKVLLRTQVKNKIKQLFKK